MSEWSNASLEDLKYRRLQNVLNVSKSKIGSK